MFSSCRYKGIFFTKYVKFSLSAGLSKSYYDALGVTPHATQNDIKSAYYKLSMMYHPDKNKDSEVASQKFRDITEAYEVLGNFKLKRLYDKGLLHTAESQYSGSVDINFEEDHTTKFYKSRLKRDKPPPPTGRTPIYNFDEWANAHYGSTFAKQTTARQRYEDKKRQQIQNSKDIQSEIVVFGLLLFVMCSYVLSAVVADRYDVVDSPCEANENKDVP